MNHSIQLVTFDIDFLDKSYTWLTDPEIASLTGTGKVTRLSQEEFFDGLPKREGYFIWGVCVKQQKVGAAGIKNVDGTCGEYWGYIGEKELWGRGYGTEMCHAVIEKAHLLRLQLLHLKVLKSNKRAFALYCKMGFQRTWESEVWVGMELPL